MLGVSSLVISSPYVSSPQNPRRSVHSDIFPLCLQERKRSLATGEKIGSLAELTQQAGQEYGQLDPSVKSELQERAEIQRAAYPAILEEWKKTLTPEMIKEENTVRATRRKLGLSRKANLKLDGEPKRPKTAYFLCVNCPFSPDVL